MFPLRGSRVLLAWLLSARILVIPQPFPGDSPVAAIRTQLAGRDALLVGRDWYPEQWPESRWETDLQMMEATHLQVVRVAEFAWNRMELSEGQYDFAWLGHAICLAEKHHIAVVVGTPTAAPPAWLTEKYPDTLRRGPDGQLVAHGNRALGSVTSPRYREYCRKIAEEIGKNFGHDANVVGWRIDNEYGYGQMSYDKEARKQFQDWLKSKYKTLEALNDHWTTAYWSQTYDNWEEIPIPVGGHNPGLMLDWKHFVTHAWTSYQQDQIDALKKSIEAQQFITGNFMGYGFDSFDHYVIPKPLTFVSWMKVRCRMELK